MLRFGQVPLRRSGIRHYQFKSGEFGYLPELPKAAAKIPAIRPEDGPKTNLTDAYRRFGYLAADLDLLGLKKPAEVPELDPSTYGLSGSHDLEKRLKELYCGPITIEFMHINNAEEREWLAKNYEESFNYQLTKEQRLKMLHLMMRCENFDHFMALKFPSFKRYGSEGMEGMFAFCQELFESAPKNDIEHILMAVPHRGRWNFVANLMDVSYRYLFRHFMGKDEYPGGLGLKDFFFNAVQEHDYKTADGSVRLTKLMAPSHLESNNPVAMGQARASARSRLAGDYSTENGARPGDKVLCFMLHGDGAFVGQGVVWETMAMSKVPHFRVGGTVNLVTNNQVAFTAEPHIGRSSVHCTDSAKGLEFPIIHVNGDHPEAVVRACRLAMDYRTKFRKDVYVNLISYRRWGHNELDDPSMTQPLMYKAIESRKSVPTKYAESLIADGLITEEEVKQAMEKHTAQLLEAYRAVNNKEPMPDHLVGNWAGFRHAPAEAMKWDTGVDGDFLKFVGAASVKLPETFAVHPLLKRTHCDGRVNKLTAGEGIDWGTAEALAFGSLLLEGNDVRISGEEVGRGTFSHRHAMLVDQETDHTYIPLNFIHKDQKAFLEVANNPLSEEATMGFEYGFSLDSPKRLVIWEAQFGDFFNGAQIIVDCYIASAESKFMAQSGLTLLLPHGFDGAGPEHSSTRMERFLQLCDSREDQKPVDGENVNMRVANPTTSAQYFHLLRRQVLPDYRKPLVVIAPKILLRHPKFLPGTHFREVIDDSLTQKNKVKKVIFVSGKHWIALEKARDERGLSDSVPIVRLESLCPFPVQAVKETMAGYPNAKEFIWSQEEPRNAGAWSFVQPRFANGLGVSLKYAGRPEIAYIATAIADIHAQEAEEVIKMTFE